MNPPGPVRGTAAVPAARRGRAVRALAAVFAGGFAGSSVRELLTPLLPAPWPWLPTAIINVLACFLIGLLYGDRDRLGHAMLHFGAIGFCGGLSTFSHFARDVETAWLATGPGSALAAVLASVIPGVLAAVLGEALTRRRRSSAP